MGRAIAQTTQEIPPSKQSALDIEDIIEQLTLEEKVALTAGTLRACQNRSTESTDNTQARTFGIPSPSRDWVFPRSDSRMDQTVFEGLAFSMVYLHHVFRAGLLSVLLSTQRYWRESEVF